MLASLKVIQDDRQDEGHLFDLVRAHVGMLVEVMQNLRETFRRKSGVAHSGEEEVKVEEIVVEVDTPTLSAPGGKTPSKAGES
jgi:hypothetical protein